MSNMEMLKISLSYNVETSSVHPFPVLRQVLALNSMRQNLQTEKFLFIDTMLKVKTQEIALLLRILL